MTVRVGVRCLAVVVGAVLTSGCGGEEPPPPIEFGSAQTGGARLGLQTDRGSAVRLSQWPDACDLMSDAEIRAILPQAKSIEREPVKVTVLQMNPLGDAAPGTTGDVPRGGCEFGFALPDGSGETWANSQVTVTVTAVADPSLTAERYEEDKGTDGTEKGFTDLANSWGAEGCYAVDAVGGGAEVHCRQGPYLFEATGSSHADGVAPGPGPDAGPAENLVAAKRRHEVWTDKVLSQFVRTVGARMS